MYSTSLDATLTAKTRIERSFDPTSVARLKAAAARDLSIGGPHLAAEAMRAGLVDEVQLFLTPIVVGGGNSALPANVRVKLELIDQCAFGDGVVYLHYRTMR